MGKQKNEEGGRRVKKYNPYAKENIALEALAAEAKRRKTTYGKLVSVLDKEQINEIIKRYREKRYATGSVL